MDYDVSQSGDAPKAVWPIEVGEDRSGTVFAPDDALIWVAYQYVNAVMTEQAGHHTARNITAADNQEVLHCAILPD